MITTPAAHPLVAPVSPAFDISKAPGHPFSSLVGPPTFEVYFEYTIVRLMTGVYSWACASRNWASDDLRGYHADMVTADRHHRLSHIVWA